MINNVILQVLIKIIIKTNKNQRKINLPVTEYDK